MNSPRPLPQSFLCWLLWLSLFLGLTTCAPAQETPTQPQSSPFSTATVLHSFTIQNFQTNNNIDGITFTAPLVLGRDGDYYGVAQSGGPSGTGTVFKVTRTGILTVLFAFQSGNVNSTGATPSGALVEDPTAQGTFYGTTQSGGDNASGTLFKIVTTGPITETILHSFGDPGTPNDGIIPAGALAVRGTVLYGTAAGGGAHGNAGVIYRIDTDGTGYALLHSFTPATDGSNPRGLVLGAALYGVTRFGGPNSAGVVWSLGTDGAGFQVLYSFGGADGYSKPSLSLALAGDGALYGSFGNGTPDGFGGIFKINPQGVFTLLHAFVFNFASGTHEGGWPGPVTLGADGNLYGQLGQIPFNTPVTQFNPSSDSRHFEVSTSGGTLTLLAASTTRRFQGYGEAALTAAPDGTFYGLENNAGATGYGDVILLRPAPPHVLTVSSLGDDAADSTTLRGAINAAQPGDTITFSPALQSTQNTITLSQGELFISQDLNIVYAPTQNSDGVSGSLTVDANGLSRVFHIGGGVVDISGLTLTNGFVQGMAPAETPAAQGVRPLGQPGPDPSNTTQGGGVLIDGSAAVLLSGVTIGSCTVTGANMVEGGGLCLVSGDLTFNSSSIINCSAITGGGMAVDTGAFIDGSPLPGGALLNFSTSNANKAMEGGGLATSLSGPVGMFFGTVTNNQAGDNGGGVYDSGGRTVIDNTTLSGNMANGVTISAGGFSPFISSGSGAGGGLYNIGGFENLDNDVFRGNSAYSGGALDIASNEIVDAGTTKIYFTTFTGNTAVLSVNGMNPPGPLNGDGGAITVDGGTLNLLQSTVGGAASENTAGNHADTDGGGIYINNGTATINDITFYGNTAADSGGAVYNSAANDSDVTFYYCTITNNDAINKGGGLYQDFNVGVTNPFTVYSTIIAQNTLHGSSSIDAGQDAAVTAGGTFTSNGSNLIGNGVGAIGLDANGVNHDQVGNVGGSPVLDPRLFPLGEYGGTTLTRTLQPGSPALHMSFNIDEGLNKFDQRGVQRPYPDPYDIGAAEHPAPHVQDQSYTTSENTALVTPAPGVLVGAYADLSENPNPYPLTAADATLPAHGSLTLNVDGSFTYTPDPGFIGTDTFTYAAFDTIATSVPATVTILVIGAVPTTTATLSGTPGSNGYYRSAVTVTLSATDPDYASNTLTTDYSADGGPQQTYYAPGIEGGAATGTGPFIVSGDGAHTVTFFSTDPGGSAETPKTITINIDATPPVLTFGTPFPAPNASGYSNKPVSIAYTTADATSGVAGATPGSPVLFSTDGKNQTQMVTVTDNAGNSAAFVTPAVSVDTTPPVTTGGTQAGPTGTQVTLRPTDAFSGVADTVYALDGGPSQAYVGPFVVSQNGTHTVVFHSTDKAGNVEADHTLAVTVRVAGPHTTIALAGPQGTNGWYTGTVTVTLTAAAAGLPIASTFYALDGGPQQTYTKPFPLSGDAVHTLRYFSTDTAGNTETANQQSVKIDATPPVTTASTSGSQATPRLKTGATGTAYSGPVTVTLAATDALSGVASTFYSLDGAAEQTYTKPFTVTASGAHTVTYGSVDVAGNRETAHALAFTIASATTPVLHTFPTGLQLFSVPKDMSGIPLGQVFNPNPGKMAVWVPSLLQYVLTPNAPADAIRPGQGYWARFGASTDLYDLGTTTPTGQPFAIPIHLGWNMIGDPFPAAVSASNLRVQTTTGVFGLNDSVARILLSPTTYSYDSGAGQYQPHNVRTDSLTPYVGYWLYSRCEGSLLVNAP